jgi:hypothetical protein
LRTIAVSPKVGRIALIAVLSLGLASFASSAPVSAAGGPGTWALSKNLLQARGFAPAVTLGDGSVITAGGTDGINYTATAERWTSAGGWVAAGSIGAAVDGQVAALLPGGKALFAGGAGSPSYYGFGDLFDGTTGHWTQTPAMTHNHAFGAGAQLTNGNLLVIGGMDGGAGVTTSAVDIYSASGNSWSAGASLPGSGRYALTATEMADGRILVAGGNDGTFGANGAMSAAAIYTSGSGWTSIEAMKAARFDHGAVKLKDGRILVAGGSNGSGAALSSTEIYDPATGHWTLTGSMKTARYGMTMTLLASGWVLVTGGYSSGTNTALRSAEIYDPATQAWSSTGSMLLGRRFHAATTLADGSVLVTGGHVPEGDYFGNSTEIFTPPLYYPSTTFHPLAPARLLDTRTNLGLTGQFSNRSPRLLTVIGRGGVPDDAVAVTGIVTVTNQSAGGYISVGPVATSTPTSSTLNFPLGDNRANSVTVALDSQGRLAFVLCVPCGSNVAGTSDMLFDVTGYFTADDTGATFMPLEPARLLDTRDETGLKGAFETKKARFITVVGHGNVPAGAVAVTGNLTVVRPSSSGWAFAGPSIPADPTTLNVSMVNAKAGEIKADGITVALGESGKLYFVWVGAAESTADLLFDVTGYFVMGTGGSRYIPLDPIRMADTRSGLPAQGPIGIASPVVVPVAGKGHVGLAATGVTGNLTVVGQTAGGFLTAAPVATTTMTATSTLNFPAGDVRANAFDLRLAGDGSLGVVYFAATGAKTNFVLDITGYFAP